jgi:MFS superfamily sulfate permease-like transporter
MAPLPTKIITEIEKTSNFIAENLNFELWDDAAFMLIESLRRKANRKFRINIAGTKLTADVYAHLNKSALKDRYSVIQKVTV